MAAEPREFPEQPDITPHEAAELAACSYWTVLEEIKRGNLRAYQRAGNRLAIRHDDFCEWAYGAPVVPNERDEPAERPPRRRRRSPARGSVSPLKELELRRRGAA